MGKPITSRLCAALLVAVAALAGGLRTSLADPPLEGVFADNFILSEVPAPAPSVAFRDLDGAETGLGAYAGQVVLLNFWATWCAPCIREMPSLDRLQEELAGEGLKVVAVSVDRGGAAAVKPFADELGLRHLTILTDPKFEAARAFVIRGLPATFLIDGQGRIVGGLEGPAEWDSPEALKLVRFYLSGEARDGRRQSARRAAPATLTWPPNQRVGTGSSLE